MEKRFTYTHECEMCGSSYIRIKGSTERKCGACVFLGVTSYPSEIEVFNDIDGYIYDPFEEEVRMSEVLKELKECLDQLNERERDVITLRFGLGETTELTLEEIAKYLNLTRERVRQIESSAIKKLKHPKVQKELKKAFYSAGYKKYAMYGYCFPIEFIQLDNIEDNRFLYDKYGFMIDNVPYIYTLRKNDNVSTYRIKTPSELKEMEVIKTQKEIIQKRRDDKKKVKFKKAKEMEGGICLVEDTKITVVKRKQLLERSDIEKIYSYIYKPYKYDNPRYFLVKFKNSDELKIISYVKLKNEDKIKISSYKKNTMTLITKHQHPDRIYMEIKGPELKPFYAFIQETDVYDFETFIELAKKELTNMETRSFINPNEYLNVFLDPIKGIFDNINGTVFTEYTLLLVEFTNNKYEYLVLDKTLPVRVLEINSKTRRITVRNSDNVLYKASDPFKPVLDIYDMEDNEKFISVKILDAYKITHILDIMELYYKLPNYSYNISTHSELIKNKYLGEQ